MKSKKHSLILWLSVLFIGCSSQSVIKEESQSQTNVEKEDGLEGRTINNDSHHNDYSDHGHHSHHSYHHGHHGHHGHHSHHYHHKTECPFPYVAVNDMCLYSFCSPSAEHTFLQANASCLSISMGSKLAMFKSGNEYTTILSYLKQIDPAKLCSYWVGGSNQYDRGVWKWYSEELVPMGIPFWATVGSPPVLQPSSVNTAIYTLLSKNYHWGTINVNNNAQATSGNGNPISKMPLCQYVKPKEPPPPHHHHHHHHGGYDHHSTHPFLPPYYPFLY